MKGETSPHVQKLQFDAKLRSADVDKPAEGMKEAMKDMVSSDIRLSARMWVLRLRR